MSDLKPGDSVRNMLTHQYLGVIDRITTHQGVVYCVVRDQQSNLQMFAIQRLELSVVQDAYELDLSIFSKRELEALARKKYYYEHEAEYDKNVKPGLKFIKWLIETGRLTED
jgi:hypothetical protein